MMTGSLGVACCLPPVEAEQGRISTYVISGQITLDAEGIS